MGATAAAAVSSDVASAKVKGSKKKLILIAAPVLVAVMLAGLWFSGILPRLLGRGHEPAKASGKAAAAPPPAPVFIELPEMIANLDASGHRASYVKLKARLQLTNSDDLPAFIAAQPRVMDLFTVYLRETRPEELQERAGTDRLRAALVARANFAVAPARVSDVLFSELLVQ